MKASLANPDEATWLLPVIPSRVRSGSGTLMRSLRSNSPKQQGGGEGRVVIHGSWNK